MQRCVWSTGGAGAAIRVWDQCCNEAKHDACVQGNCTTPLPDWPKVATTRALPPRRSGQCLVYAPRELLFSILTLPGRGARASPFWLDDLILRGEGGAMEWIRGQGPERQLQALPVPMLWLSRLTVEVSTTAAIELLRTGGGEGRTLVEGATHSA